MPESDSAQNVKYCQELWANAYDHQANINQRIPMLRAQIKEIASMFEEDSIGTANCDIANQILTDIEKENNKPLTAKPEPPPMPQPPTVS